jgi:hypothetical protein
VLEARREGCAWGVVDPSRVGETVGLLETIFVPGMELLRNIDWRGRNSSLLSMMAEQTGVDLAA